MNIRQNTIAILNYENYDKMPIVHFGFWPETVQKWYNEGHVTKDEAENYKFTNSYEASIAKRLGFDFNWSPDFGLKTLLDPEFPVIIVKEIEQSKRYVQNPEGVVVLEDDNIVSIPTEISHTLKDRKSWEEEFLPRLQYKKERADLWSYNDIKTINTDRPHGLFIGSMFGRMRNWMGVVEVSYLLYDDEELYDEIINTVGNLTYLTVKESLVNIKESNITFDYAHWWEDICFKNGPLIAPDIFNKKIGHHYKRINDLLNEFGIKIISLDCDGFVDPLIPTWLNNGINTMFPIEVGTWNASITLWREKYGKELRGVGGMNKNTFSKDKKAIDMEIERIKKMVELGGYIPCPDHLIATDAKWELIQYYTDSLRKTFSR